jgi:hypothetical protein
MNTSVNAGARLDRLPISSFHKRIFLLIGAGMFFDGYDLYVGTNVLGAVVQSKFATLEAALRTALATCDLVVLSGGTSKGAGDLSHGVVARLGDPGILVHGVALKPGKPLCLALIEGKPVAVLPGFPTSAIFTFHAFIAPVIRARAGLPTHTAHVIERPMRPHHLSPTRATVDFGHGPLWHAALAPLHPNAYRQRTRTMDQPIYYFWAGGARISALATRKVNPPCHRRGPIEKAHPPDDLCASTLRPKLPP